MKTWIAGEVLTASDQNAEFDNVLDNDDDLGNPATKAYDLDGNELILDSDADTSITADSDDRIDFRALGQDIARLVHTVTVRPTIVLAHPANIATVLTTVVSGNDAATEDIFSVEPVSDTLGGAFIKAMAEDAALERTFLIEAYGGTANTVKTTSGLGLVQLYASEHDGANALADITADGNVLAVRARVGGTDVTLLLLDEDGDLILPSSGNLANSGTTAITMDSNGHVTFPNTCSFLAHNSVADANQTGNGTTATIEFDTEIFDQNADFNNTTDTFTAPVTGRYLLTATILSSGYGAGATGATTSIVTSNRTYRRSDSRPPTSAGSYQNTISTIADMDAADTATVTLRVTGMAGDTVDIDGGSNLDTFFSGELIA